MEADKYEFRKISIPNIPESKAIIVFKNSTPNETVLYLKPYDLEALKMVDLIDVIIDFLNKPTP